MILLFQLSNLFVVNVLNGCTYFTFSGVQLDIDYDKFIRTTDPKHEAIVKEFYSRVLANGDIYRADYEGLYCVNCEEYKVVPLHFYLLFDMKFGALLTMV